MVTRNRWLRTLSRNRARDASHSGTSISHPVCWKSLSLALVIGCMLIALAARATRAPEHLKAKTLSNPSSWASHSRQGGSDLLPRERDSELRYVGDGDDVFGTLSVQSAETSNSADARPLGDLKGPVVRHGAAVSWHF